MNTSIIMQAAVMVTVGLSLKVEPKVNGVNNQTKERNPDQKMTVDTAMAILSKCNIVSISNIYCDMFFNYICSIHMYTHVVDQVFLLYSSCVWLKLIALRQTYIGGTSL